MATAEERAFVQSIPSVDRGRFRELMWPGVDRKTQKMRERALGLGSNKERGAYLVAQGKLPSAASREDVRAAVQKAMVVTDTAAPGALAPDAAAPVVVPVVETVAPVVQAPTSPVTAPVSVPTAAPVEASPDPAQDEKVQKMAVTDTVKEWWGDLRQEAVAKGATTVPMTGAAVPTLSTPADEVVSRVGASDILGVAAKTGLAALTLAGVAAGGVAVARAVKKRRAAKKAAKKKARKAARRSKARKAGKSRAGAKRRSTGRGKAKKGKGTREDAGGVMRGTYKGQQVFKTKNGRPYILRKSGPMKGMAKFIKW